VAACRKEKERKEGRANEARSSRKKGSHTLRAGESRWVTRQKRKRGVEGKGNSGPGRPGSQAQKTNRGSAGKRVKGRVPGNLEKKKKITTSRQGRLGSADLACVGYEKGKSEYGDWRSREPFQLGGLLSSGMTVRERGLYPTKVYKYDNKKVKREKKARKKPGP